MPAIMPDPIVTIIKGRIRLTRERLGFSGEDAATACGVSRAQFWQWENQRNVMPTAYSLRRICEGLGVSADYLLGLSDKDQR